jgi:hypothetical protein
METVDPREIVKAAFRLVEVLPPLTFDISVYTADEEASDLVPDIYTVRKNNEGDFTVFSENVEPFTIHTYRDFEIILKKAVIEIIDCSTRNPVNDHVITQMILFRCEEQGCLDRRRHATSKIQGAFRKYKKNKKTKARKNWRKMLPVGIIAGPVHRRATESANNPDRLTELGLFNDPEARARYFQPATSFGKRKVCQNGALKIVNSEIKYLKIKVN